MYLKRWIILCDFHNNVIRHLVAFIFYCYQSVVDKTWTISGMPCCSKYHQSITIQQQISHHWEMIITYFTCSNCTTHKDRYLSTITNKYFPILYRTFFFFLERKTILFVLSSCFIRSIHISVQNWTKAVVIYVIKLNTRDIEFSAFSGTCYNCLLAVFVISRQNKHPNLIKWH